MGDPRCRFGAAGRFDPCGLSPAGIRIRDYFNCLTSAGGSCDATGQGLRRAGDLAPFTRHVGKRFDRSQIVELGGIV